MSFARRKTAITKYKIHEIHLRNCLHCHSNFKNRGWIACSLRFRHLSLETRRGGEERGATAGARIQLRIYPMHLTPRKAGRENAQKPAPGGFHPQNRRGFARRSAFILRVCHAQRLACIVHRNKRRVARSALIHRRRYTCVTRHITAKYSIRQARIPKLRDNSTK